MKSDASFCIHVTSSWHAPVADFTSFSLARPREIFGSYTLPLVIKVT